MKVDYEEFKKIEGCGKDAIHTSGGIHPDENTWFPCGTLASGDKVVCDECEQDFYENKIISCVLEDELDMDKKEVLDILENNGTIGNPDVIKPMRKSITMTQQNPRLIVERN